MNENEAIGAEVAKLTSADTELDNIYLSLISGKEDTKIAVLLTQEINYLPMKYLTLKLRVPEK